MTIKTQTVTFLSGPIGLVSADNPYRFAPTTVAAGDKGELIVEGELPFSVPDGWVLVKVEELYAPVHPSMIMEDHDLPTLRNWQQAYVHWTRSPCPPK